MVVDPLGLTRCQSCGNAFEYDEQEDGTCGICGGPFRRRGRPTVGSSRILVTMPDDLLATLDNYAEQRQATRSDTVRAIIAEALEDQ